MTTTSVSKLQIMSQITNFLRRGIGLIIDWYVGSVLVSLPVSIAYFKCFPNTQTILDLRILPASVAWITLFFACCIAFLYYVWVPYRNNGQTLGKKIVKVRIEEIGKDKITLSALIKRQVLGIILLEGSLFSISTLCMQMLTFGNNDILQSITYFHYAITMISVLLCLLTKQHRAIHDHIANTRITKI